MMQRGMPARASAIVKSSSLRGRRTWLMESSPLFHLPSAVCEPRSGYPSIARRDKHMMKIGISAAKTDGPFPTSGPDQFDRIPDRHVPGLNHPRVQGEPASELAAYFFQDADILNLGVRVEGRHDAALPQVREADHDRPDSQGTVLPVPLDQTGHSPDQNVGPQSSPVESEGLHRPVRGDQEGENVESMEALVENEASSGTCRNL